MVGFLSWAVSTASSGSEPLPPVFVDPVRTSRVAINYEKLVNWQIPEVEQRLTRRDTILYALGVGLGADPCDADQLRFVYEPNLEALPSMAIVLGYPGPWHAQG